MSAIWKLTIVNYGISDHHVAYVIYMYTVTSFVCSLCINNHNLKKKKTTLRYKLGWSIFSWKANNVRLLALQKKIIISLVALWYPSVLWLLRGNIIGNVTSIPWTCSSRSVILRCAMLCYILWIHLAFTTPNKSKNVPCLLLVKADLFRWSKNAL